MMTREQIEQMDSRELDRQIALMLGWQEIPERDWEIIVRVRKQEGNWRGMSNDFKMPRDMINPDGYFCGVPNYSNSLQCLESLLKWAHDMNYYVEIKSAVSHTMAIVQTGKGSFDFTVRKRGVEALPLALCRALLLSIVTENKFPFFYGSRISTVMLGKNGMVAVFDRDGNQIPECQGVFSTAWPAILETIPIDQAKQRSIKWQCSYGHQGVVGVDHVCACAQRDEDFCNDLA